MQPAEAQAHFAQQGYVVLRGVVPKPMCDAVIDAIWAFTGYDPDAPHLWSGPPQGMTGRWPQQDIGMLPMFHHQAMWDIRQHPAVHAAFAAILGQQALWVSIDRVSFKPQNLRDDAYFAARGVHWDIDTSTVCFPLPAPRPVQGLVMLADTAEDQGGFHCVPSIYADLEAFLAHRPAGSDPWHLDASGHEIVRVSGQAGDLIIWDSLLPHGNGINQRRAPRFAQYITMTPVDQRRSREADIAQWRNNVGPDWAPGDPRERERTGQPAILSPLGRRLLGLDAWG